MPTIENATITLSPSGVIYRIKANEGYVLHDNTLDAPAYDENDEPLLDENGNPVIILGFTAGTCAVSTSYDFEVNPRGFYTVS